MEAPLYKTVRNFTIVHFAIFNSSKKKLLCLRQFSIPLTCFERSGDCAIHSGKRMCWGFSGSCIVAIPAESMHSPLIESYGSYRKFEWKMATLLNTLTAVPVPGGRYCAFFWWWHQFAKTFLTCGTRNYCNVFHRKF